MTDAGLKYLWDSGATDSMIKIRHTKYYELKIWSNKVEYSTATGFYCTAHDVKVPLFVPELSRSKIIHHLFHVNNYKGELVICYDMIIGHDLMVKLVMKAEFKHQLLQ